MKPKFRTINMYQGQTLRDQLVFVDGAGAPIDLSAKTARMQVRTSIDDPTVIFELTTANGGITMDANGLVTFNMSATATAALFVGIFEPQEWVFDLEIITTAAPTDIVDRVLTGVVTFSPEITRA